MTETRREIFASHDTDRATNGPIGATDNKLGVLKRISVDRPSTALLRPSGLATPAVAA
jgi:hypothetical protein